MLKILHVIPSIAPVRGGPSSAVTEMVKNLQNIGIDVEIITTNDNGSTLLDVPLNVLSKYQGISVRFFDRFSPPINPLREFAFSAGLTFWLWQHLHEYDLLHVHGIFSYPSTIAMLIARLQNVPYINCPHGVLCQWSLQQKKNIKEAYLNLIEKGNLLNSQGLHLSTRKEQEEFKFLDWNLSSFILPHGLDFPVPIANSRKQLHQMLDIPLQTPIILALSRLHPVKGFDYLIPALGKLRDRDQNFAFVLAGNGTTEYEAEIDQLLQANHLGDRTYKLGFVSGEKKNICLQGADLYALTSHSENFGIAVLEALAAGTPALVTTGVALADLVKEQNLGWVVDLDVEAIASAIQDFLDHPQFTQQIGDRARQFILENYTWDKIAIEMVSVYNGVIEKSEKVS